MLEVRSGFEEAQTSTLVCASNSPEQVAAEEACLVHDLAWEDDSGQDAEADTAWEVDSCLVERKTHVAAAVGSCRQRRTAVVSSDPDEHRSPSYLAEMLPATCQHGS